MKRSKKIFLVSNFKKFKKLFLYDFEVSFPGVAQIHWNLSLTTYNITKRTAAS